MHLQPDEVKKSVTRLKRAHGQLAGVIRMLEEGNECDQAIMQLAAVSKALDKAGYSIIVTGMKKCFAEGEGASSIEEEKLEKLFLSLS